MSIFTNSISAAKEEADGYVTAVLKLLDDKDPLVVLGRLISELENLVNGLTSEELRRPEAPGKWSILEVIHHLADSELVWAYRLRLVLAEKQPEITGYDQDRWASQLKYREAKLEDVASLDPRQRQHEERHERRQPRTGLREAGEGFDALAVLTAL